MKCADEVASCDMKYVHTNFYGNRSGLSSNVTGL
jgi:hypothetical protein